MGSAKAEASKSPLATVEAGQGRQFRQQRNDQVLSIIARRKKVQYAADTVWPPGQPGSAKARVEFQLPKNRPFSY